MGSIVIFSFRMYTIDLTKGIFLKIKVAIYFISSAFRQAALSSFCAKTLTQHEIVHGFGFLVRDIAHECWRAGLLCWIRAVLKASSSLLRGRNRGTMATFAFEALFSSQKKMPNFPFKCPM